MLRWAVHRCIRKGICMLSQKKILVVEDNELNRQLLCQILGSEYDVLEAENGKEALKVLKQYGEGISLILLDIVMPVMNGYTFLSVMKENPEYSSIPVIVTTQNDAESDELAALSHGASDFVTKPYRPRIILHRVAGRFWLPAVLKVSMENILRYTTINCAAVCCMTRPSRTVWRTPWPKNSFRSISSQNTGS